MSAGLATSLVLVGFGTASAQADEPQDVTCTTGQTGTTVHDVTVPKGGSCSLQDVTVTGSISLSGGGNRLDLLRTNVTGGVSTVDWNTNTSAATISATSSTVTGDVVVDNTKGTFSGTRLGSLKTGGFQGDDITLTAATVDRNAVIGGRYTSFAMTSSTVKGDLTGGYAGTKVTSSTVEGRTDLGGLSLHLCGSTFGSTQLDAAITAGDNADCAGNTFNGDLTVGTSGTVRDFYHNVVTGNATSPEQPNTPAKGGDNTFKGEVTGVLATLK